MRPPVPATHVVRGVTREQVANHSPMLADRLAVSSDRGLPFVVDQLMRALNLKGLSN